MKNTLDEGITCRMAAIKEKWPEATIYNAVLDYFDIECSDDSRGILTFKLGVQFDGSGQGWGSFNLESCTSQFLYGVFDIFERDSVSKLIARRQLPLRVVKRDKGWGEFILGIGHFYKDMWLVPDSYVAPAWPFTGN